VLKVQLNRIAVVLVDISVILGFLRTDRRHVRIKLILGRLNST
jgi:hypothetical protein